MSRTYQLHLTAPSHLAKDSIWFAAEMSSIKKMLPLLLREYPHKKGWTYSLFIIHPPTSHHENVSHKLTPKLVEMEKQL